MRYVGGKARIAAWVESNILKLKQEQTSYLEPFVGGANTLHIVGRHFQSIYAGDLNKDLILLLNAVGKGWKPYYITKERYFELKKSEASAERGFAGFGCSFGGKWFGGYVDTCWDNHHKRITKPYWEAASRSLLKISSTLNRTKFSIGSYDQWQPNANYFVYCDPPYRGTLGYGTDFDHESFWNCMTSWREKGSQILVSEQEAPPHWKIFDERTRKAQLRVSIGKENTQRIERLFYLP